MQRRGVAKRHLRGIASHDAWRSAPCCALDAAPSAGAFRRHRRCAGQAVRCL